MQEPRPQVPESWAAAGTKGSEDGKHGFDGYLRRKTMYVNGG
jgi:hypothetical protein